MSVYIHGGLRSPIGVLNGQYKYMRPEILGAQLIDELINRHTISQVDGIFCGNAVGTGGNIGRLMGLMCNLPNFVPAITVDMQCASALMSIEWPIRTLHQVLWMLLLLVVLKAPPCNQIESMQLEMIEKVYIR